MSHKTPISAMRIRAGLTQSELAQMIGVSENTIANWEKGSASKWIRHLIKLCDALNCDLSDLNPDIASRDERMPHLTPRLLSNVRDYCEATLARNKKAAFNIASFATQHEPKLRYWLDQANWIMAQSQQDNGGELDPEAVSNALILQQLTSQLSLSAPNDITATKFLDIVQESRLSDKFLRRYASFSTENAKKDQEAYRKKYVRKLILQTNFLAVYVIGWRPGQESWIHHHGNSLDVIYVVDGVMTHWLLSPELWETENPSTPFEGSSVGRYEGNATQIQKGQFIVIPRRHAHQISNMSDAEMTTLHVRWGPPPDDDNWDSPQLLSEKRLIFEGDQKGLFQFQQP